MNLEVRLPDGSVVTNLEALVSWLRQNPQYYEQVFNEQPSWAKKAITALMGYYDALETNDPNAAFKALGESGLEMSDYTEKYLDNLIARENTTNQQAWEEHMRDTDTLSQGSQLAQLGLSSGGVLSIGGANHNGVGVADNSFHSAAESREQRALAKYQTRMNMARGVLGMVGQMASSGIYGASIGAARNAAATLSSAAAHSGLQALNRVTGKFKKSDFPRMPSDKVGGFYSIFEQ